VSAEDLLEVRSHAHTGLDVWHPILLFQFNDKWNLAPEFQTGVRNYGRTGIKKLMEEFYKLFIADCPVPRWLSRYSDWLRAGRPRVRSLSPSRVKNFHFSTSSRPALRFTQPPNLTGCKAAGA
jgi:hypothetical protein